MANGTCIVDGCERIGRLRRGWCDLHYQRWRAHGDPTVRLTAERDAVCQRDDCDRDHCARGYCKMHYNLWRISAGHAEKWYPIRTCNHCGQQFRGNRSSGNVYCSHECYVDSWRLTEDERQSRRRADRAKRRSLERSALEAGESIDPYDIYDRDGWRCGICLKPVAKSYLHPDPRSVSLDHIIPLAAGGTHTRDNVQCSHLRCNSSKGARGPGQIRLVG